MSGLLQGRRGGGEAARGVSGIHADATPAAVAVFNAFGNHVHL